MKVIDLLIKIANDEEVPKIIKYNDYVLYYEKDMKDYYDKEVNHPLLDTQCQFILNDEVEVIEDTPKEYINVSEEQVLFNNLSYEEQQFILKQMRILQPPKENKDEINEKY
jgi:hypothetical protein